MAKDKVKESIQRSPDIFDNLLMRMYFIVSNEHLVLSNLKTAEEVPENLQYYSVAGITKDNYYLMLVIGIVGREMFLEDVIYTNSDSRYFEPKTIEMQNKYNIKKHILIYDKSLIGHIKSLKNSKKNSTKINAINPTNTNIQANLGFVLNNFHLSENTSTDYVNYINDLKLYDLTDSNTPDIVDLIFSIVQILRNKFNLH